MSCLIGSIDGPTHLAVVQENIALKAEIERLREDAERYRFIRHYQVSVLDVDGDGDCVWIVNAEEFDELDTAIDAAIDATREAGDDG